MKRGISFLLFSLIFIFTSCKFDSAPLGVYTGTYTAYNMPQTSGSATFTIVENGAGLYDVTCDSEGNPVIYRSGILFDRIGSLYGNTYSYYGSSDPDHADTTFTIHVREYDPYGSDGWNLGFSYEYSLSPGLYSLDFEGVR